MHKLIQTMAAIAVGVMSTGTAFATIGTNPVPEPGTWALIGIGLAAAVAIGRRKK